MTTKTILIILFSIQIALLATDAILRERTLRKIARNNKERERIGRELKELDDKLRAARYAGWLLTQRHNQTDD